MLKWKDPRVVEALLRLKPDPSFGYFVRQLTAELAAGIAGLLGGNRRDAEFKRGYAKALEDVLKNIQDAQNQ